jgi:hypothetical protein
MTLSWRFNNPCDLCERHPLGASVVPDWRLYRNKRKKEKIK